MPGSGGGSRLRWQYGSHRWAEISVQGAADKAGTVYRIAESIVFGTAKPTAFPFRVRGLPDGLTIYRSTAGPGRGSGDATVSFAAGAYSPNNGLEISVTPAGLMNHLLASGPGRKITVLGTAPSKWTTAPFA